ncbi:MULTISPECIES: CBS domain-containing protein [Geobacillus]|uniref:CBS domain-containing protein n=1 Tax=Geobacillus zalihae TaxID=213419 RepID=A0A7H1RVP1_9BACL|nr:MULTISPECIES: CBS domain-containing protein [Geobacillus]EPR28052.1 CBS domain containing protein [Geobacillus sp. WSUCF1]MCG6795096.1 CBS domain-containing protein [Geobacillus sp. YHL]OQP24755.1 CBS domain-containing protein [Geobacillus zalihae]QNU18330.1 CBS domain-containing protein [Geobacillus zalihae]RXS84368.1 CBS domain-containing protein [Geobacillus sp. PK12]
MQTVRDVMSTDVQYCTPLDNLYEVAVKMRDFNVGAIPIVDDGRLVGMITDRDIVVRGMAEKRPGSTAVTEVMSRDLVTLSPDDSVQKAADMMARHQIRRLPVVENGRLVGIISLGDLATNRYSDERAGRALSEISEQDAIH